MSRAIIVWILLSLVPAPAPAQQEASVRVAEETAPPGGVAVIQIELTEPVPILTGDVTVGKGGSVLGRLCGLGLFSSALDVVGVGTRQGDQTRIRFLGFSGQVGLSEDLPVMVVAFDIEPGAAIGARGSLDIIESTLRLEAPGGAIYRNDIKPGTVTVGGVSITAVSPSNGIVPAGAQIQFHGVGFQPDADVDVDGVDLNNVQVLNSAEIVATAAQTFRIENRRIRLRNRANETEDFFYTFTSAKLAPASANALLRDAIPVHSATTLQQGTLAASPDLVGLSVRNLNATPANVRVRAFDAAGSQIADRTTALAAEIESTLTPGEWLAGADLAGAVTFAFEADQPVQALGLRFEDQSFSPAVLSDAPPPVPAPPTRPAINSGGWIQAPLTPVQNVLAPLAITTLFGSGFAPQGFSAEAGPADVRGGRLPTNLGGVCVEIEGRRAPLFFVSEGQINVQALGHSAGAVSAVVVRGCGTTEESRSAPETVAAAARNPAWFVLGSDPSGVNPIAALHGGGPVVVTDAQPGASGEVVSLFATGLGATVPPLAPGVIPRAVMPGVPPVVEGAVSVRVGGAILPAADVLYVGAAPCCAGLYQVTVRLPANAPSGRLPVSISIDGAASPPGPYLSVEGL